MRTGEFVLGSLAATAICIGWLVTKVVMGFEWTATAYKVGVDAARGVETE